MIQVDLIQMDDYPADSSTIIPTALANLGGHAGHTPPPTEPNSFIFAYIFVKKCPCQRSTPHLTGPCPPLREILDPPLPYGFLFCQNRPIRTKQIVH